MELIDGDLKVELIDIGEGWRGDYDETDPEDEPLLRFYVSRRGNPEADEEEWVDLDDASYCTCLRADIGEAAEAFALGILMGAAKRGLSGSMKHVMAEASWIGDPSYPLDDPSVV